MLRNLWEVIWYYVPRFMTEYISVDMRTWQEVSQEEYLAVPPEDRATFRVEFFNLFGYPTCYRSIEIMDLRPE